MMARASDAVRNSLTADVVCPKRFGNPTEFAALVRRVAWRCCCWLLAVGCWLLAVGADEDVLVPQAKTIIENPYLNGVTIRIDGGIRMSNL